MIDRLLQTLYNKLFINIVLDGKESSVYIELCSNGKNLELLKNAQQTFQTESVNIKMLEFIESYTRETPYFYLSVLDTSSSQGALPTCDATKFSLFGEIGECESRCVGQKWSYYTQKSELKALINKYERVGVDFVFSPFAILSRFFKDKVETSFALFVLIQQEQVTLSVFSEGALLFAKNVDMEFIPQENSLTSSYLDEELELDLDDGIDLEGVDVDSEEMELIDDFGDIEDLDSLEEIDEFSEEKEIKNSFDTVFDEKKSDFSSNESFNEDYARFKIIHAALGEYYQDKRYESRFVENIYVADSVSMSMDFKRYLEEELFVNVFVRRIEMVVELCELAKMELKA